MKTTLVIVALLLLGACETGPEKPAPAAPGQVTVQAPVIPVPSSSPAELPVVAPFDIEFLRKARWAAGHEGFDAALPGYHLAGDIARVRLIPFTSEKTRSGRLPETLVITLQTSPGMPPNVENLTITAGGLILTTALSNGTDGKGTIEIRKAGDGPRGEVKTVPQSDYLELKAVGATVQLRLLPGAMKLLGAGGELSWIDWYRG